MGGAHAPTVSGEKAAAAATIAQPGAVDAVGAAEGRGAGVPSRAGGAGPVPPVPPLATPVPSPASARDATGSAALHDVAGAAPADAVPPALSTAHSTEPRAAKSEERTGIMLHDGRPVSRASAHVAVAYFIFRQQARAPVRQTRPVALLHCVSRLCLAPPHLGPTVLLPAAGPPAPPSS